MGFDDLDAAAGEQEQDREQDETPSEREPDSDTTTDTEPAADSDTGSDEQAAVDPREEPAFEFSETDQHQVYVRGETWSAWEKTRDGQVKPSLVMDDVEDVRKSELQDAVLRLAAENPEQVAEYVRDARGLDDE